MDDGCIAPSLPSPILCPWVRKPCHLLSGQLLWSDRCPDVICLHLWPPSVLLVQIAEARAVGFSFVFFNLSFFYLSFSIYIKCIGGSYFLFLGADSSSSGSPSTAICQLSFFPPLVYQHLCLLHCFSGPWCLGFNATELHLNLHFFFPSALVLAWQEKD